MRDANYCEDIKRLIMSMLQKQSAYRPKAKQVLEVVKKHKCTHMKEESKPFSPRVMPGTFFFSSTKRKIY